MTDRVPPRIDDAPGLRFLPRRVPLGWICQWQCRTDIARQGFRPTKRTLLFIGSEPTEEESVWIAKACRALQDEMLAWAREQRGVPEAPVFDGTLRNLVYCYQTDKDSGYCKVRYHVRQNYDYNCKRLVEEHGDALLSHIRARHIKSWHEDWSMIGLPTARGMITQFRTILGFGASILENADCQRLRALLREMRFKGPKVSEEFLEFDQAKAICVKARAAGFLSIALMQALEFEGTLRQKDTIGEWVPVGEPGLSEITDWAKGGNWKWLRGMRWNEIDSNLILRHETSKKGKMIVVDLQLAPMVMDELTQSYPGLLEVDEVTKKTTIHRHLLPSDGPVIIHEKTGLPWRPASFRIAWRKIKLACGIPDEIKNMHSRHGAITEATEAGASLEDVRHAATHSNISMTQRYSRDQAKRTASVMKQRVAARVNKPGT